MLHPCPTQFACTGVFDLLSPPLLNACRSDSSRLYPSSLSAALSESAVAHRLIRVGAARPESASPSRVNRPDPSQPGRSESHGPLWVRACSGVWASHPPTRSSHDGHRSPNHYNKGVRGYRAIARRRRRAGAGGALPYSRGAAVRRGFDSRGRPRVVLGLSTRAVDPEVPPSVGACMEARVRMEAGTTLDSDGRCCCRHPGPGRRLL